MLKCEYCNYCYFDERNGRPNRYYCTHRKSKSVLAGYSSATLICKTERRSEEFIIKRTPKWCPLIREKMMKLKELIEYFTIDQVKRILRDYDYTDDEIEFHVSCGTLRNQVVDLVE